MFLVLFLSASLCLHLHVAMLQPEFYSEHSTSLCGCSPKVQAPKEEGRSLCVQDTGCVQDTICVQDMSCVQNMGYVEQDLLVNSPTAFSSW